MKNCIRYTIFLCLVALFCVSCHDFRHDAQRFTRDLNLEATRAMNITSQLEKVLLSGTPNMLDSLLAKVQDADEQVFYVFDNREMKFWSSSWLSVSYMPFRELDSWDLYQFDNAVCLGRWTKVNDYKIFTVIPLKYDYPFENDRLRNCFAEPFSLPSQYDMRKSKGDSGIAIAIDDQYVFTLYDQPLEAEVREEDSRFNDTFAYRNLLANSEVHEKVHVYFNISNGIVIFLLLLGIFGIIRFRGLRHLPLRLRFQYLIVSLLLAIFTLVLMVSSSYVSHQVDEQQVEELEKKATYIQHELQGIYYKDIDLSEISSSGLNAFLRDLCFPYKCDIQVYGFDGELLGTSTPVLFERGIISRKLDPTVLVQRPDALTQNEKVGELEFYTSYVPFLTGNYLPLGYIKVSAYPSDDVHHLALDEYFARLLPPYILAMLISVLIGIFSIRRLIRPLDSLADGMKNFRIGQRNARLQYDRKDEVGVLVHEYNKIVDELEESTERLARSEREVAWRTMARQIAHEINNPLTPMKLQIQQLQRLHQQDDERFDVFFNRSTGALIEQIDNLSRIASSFSSFAKMPEVHTSKVDIAVQLFSVITLFKTNSGHVPVRYIGAEHGVIANADGEQIRQVFTNIIKNAIQAIGDNSKGDIIVILKDLNSSVEITISDNGPGIPEDIRDKVFMPNFTTKSTGTGLGLAISKNIVEGSGGSIRFETSSQGTTFFIKLLK